MSQRLEKILKQAKAPNPTFLRPLRKFPSLPPYLKLIISALFIATKTINTCEISSEPTSPPIQGDDGDDYETISKCFSVTNSSHKVQIDEKTLSEFGGCCYLRISFLEVCRFVCPLPFYSSSSSSSYPFSFLNLSV